MKWPGIAAVVVSVVCILKKSVKSNSPINSYLIRSDQDFDAKILKSNSNLVDKGFEPYGRGFFFSDEFEGANSLESLEHLRKAGADVSIVYPIVGGEDLLKSPELVVKRWVIYFGEMLEAEAKKFPELYEICRKKVLSERSLKSADVASWPFWKFWRIKSELFTKICKLDKYLVHPFTSTNLAFSFIPGSVLLSAPHIAFASDNFGLFAVLQSTIHESWVRFFASSLKDDLRYTASDCFENFPLPSNYFQEKHLLNSGKIYFEYRTKLMKEMNEGLTKLYNRFHDPDESSKEIIKLREIHIQMDKATMAAYGWSDIQLEYDFILDYDDDDDSGQPTHLRKKPFRYKFVSDVHDEILARLLSLNNQKYQEEVRLGLHKR